MQIIYARSLIISEDRNSDALDAPDLPLEEPVSEPGWEAKTYNYDAEHPHAVSAVTPDTGTPDAYVYDANGNMTCRLENGASFIQGYNAENRLSVVQKVGTGDCANPATFAAVWNFAYDGDGTRVAQAYTPYDENGNPGTPVFTEYFMGGAYEVTDGALKMHYREAPLRDCRSHHPFLRLVKAKAGNKTEIF